MIPLFIEDTSVELLVPVDGATEPLEFALDTDWEDFQDAVAKRMGVRVHDLKLGYKLNSAGAKESPRLLTSKDHLKRLISDSKKELARRRKLSKPPAKAFHVEIIDHSEEDQKVKGHRDGGSSKPSASVCPSSCYPHG